MSRKKKEEEYPSILKERSPQEKGIFIIVFVIFVLYSASLVYPFIWMFINSLKSSSEFSGGNPFSFPEVWRFSNYSRAFEMLTLDDGTTFYDMIFNSIWYTVLSSSLSVFTCTVTGYCLSKYDFKAKGIIYATAIFCMTIPIVGSMAS